MVYLTLEKLFGQQAHVPDPSIATALGKPFLLTLSAELRLKIWKFAYAPTSRAYVFRHNAPHKQHTKCRLYSIALDKSHLADTFAMYRDAMPLRLVYRQIYKETRGMRLDLDSLIVLSNLTIDACLAIQHFATWLNKCSGWYHDITTASHIVCKNMPETVHIPIFQPTNYATHLALPGFGSKLPMKRNIMAGY
ncbi:hypothetical protein P171DRAFT_489750 [Karstenula rhodostoma CBS 690.94]|uniref:Uncharacterized protein n=1 Tax=Karstenula rhodostoma CBS 690.94 TaxID=1392251 RepID=A0A9P4P7R7_9PLEO|nr:hypothetical protein P171DRAFT_489750 [Karstenula rhodostoma CBS 690.94]